MTRRPGHGSRPAIVLATVAALLAAACSSAVTAGGAGASGSAPSGPAIVADGTAAVPLLPTDRFALPEFDLGRFQTLLGQLAGKGVPVVVNVWASWCGPCRIESPNLVAAAKQYGTRVQFIGVDILDQLGPARAFIQEEGYPYPSVFDPTGAIRDGMGYLGQPVTIFFDRSGRKSGDWVGPIGMPQLASGIAKILPA